MHEEVGFLYIFKYMIEMQLMTTITITAERIKRAFDVMAVM